MGSLILSIFADVWWGRLRPACRAFKQPSNQVVWGRDQHGDWLDAAGEQTGSVAPGQMDGHKPKAISGEHAVWLSQRIRAGDFTLRGLV
jgi:hypothetical protein